MTPRMFLYAVIFDIYLYGVITGQLDKVKGKKWGEKKGPKVPLDSARYSWGENDNNYTAYSEAEDADSKEEE